MISFFNLVSSFIEIISFIILLLKFWNGEQLDIEDIIIAKHKKENTSKNSQQIFEMQQRKKREITI